MEHRGEGYDQETSVSPRHRFTPEEMRTLKECNRESFFYRSLPFAALGMTAVHLATKKGYLKASAKWGSAPKVMGAAFVGWLAGKVSYRNKCKEKFMRMPNSYMGDLMRQRTGLLPRESFAQDDIHRSTAPTDKKRSALMDRQPFSTLDTDRNVQHEGLDDIGRPSLDRSVQMSEEADTGVAKTQTTYEELRSKNREEYERRFAPQPPSRYQFPQQRAPEVADPPPRREYQSPGLAGKKNDYGDVWES